MPEQNRERRGISPRLLIIAAGEDRQEQLVQAASQAGAEVTLLAGEGPALPNDSPELVLIDGPQLDQAPTLRQLAASRSRLLYLIAVWQQAGTPPPQTTDDLVLSLDPRELKARLVLGSRVLHLEQALRPRPLVRPPRLSVAASQLSLEIQPEDALKPALNRVHALSCRHGMPYAVLLAGIDGLADYQARYGEEQAEAARQIVAQTLCSGVRKGDEVFLLGQTRWLFLCLVQNDFGLMIMGERLKDEIARLQLAHEGAPGGRLTVSLGGATYNPRAKTAEVSYEQIVARAEESLARAAAQGQGQLIIWSPALRLA